jgi:hypothetical protein
MIKSNIITNDGNYINNYYTEWLLGYLSDLRGYEVKIEELQKEFKENNYCIGLEGQLLKEEDRYCYYTNSKYDVIKKNENGHWKLIYQLRPNENK